MFNIYIDLIAKVLLIIGGINYMFIALGNIDMFNLMKMPNVSKFIFICIGLSALYFLFNRDYYLSFLGKTVIPVSNITPQSTILNTSMMKNEEMVSIKLTKLPANTRVIYWAAQKSEDIFETPVKAYANYANMGIGKTDDKGEIIFSINCPGEYKVPKFGFSTKLARHVHYRYEIPEYPGMFSRVYTQYVMC